MKVIIDSDDRTVVEYKVPKFGNSDGGNTLVVYAISDGTYVMTFESNEESPRNGAELQWRGNRTQVLQKFVDEVDCFEHDFVLELTPDPSRS